MAKPKRDYPNAPDMDERISIPLDPELAIRALLRVDPDSEPVDAKEQALDALRQAYPEDLARIGDKLRSDALRAGATHRITYVA